MAEVYFFGCNERAGHYLIPPAYERRNQQVSKLENYLDGNPGLLPWPEKLGAGALTYLPALDMTDLAWWGSPWDTRGAVNNHVLVRGKHDADAVWTAFEQRFPKLAAQLTRPTLVCSYDGKAKESP